ncbi:Beta-lactamase-like protein [Candidatus Sulfotelmatobacter kueseliae]|uniref:Beta-lactamase-like protein n=1 Tax=Candidatus Sulfotelmatobacter kueseliae TaxID=2042962 RepID=A0A2U3KGT5_9BACT|nr:Beta-lactamase-like protein [Candidatus Sulfotelmatobacter kueseliae]
MAYIQFLGAAGTVTGSKHLINAGDPSGKNGFKVLIDCGLFQGPKEWRERNWRDTPVPAKEINAVILTHAHLDHCGWIPRLVKEGFRGPIYATPPTIDLCGIILPDSGHLQEEDAAFYNKTKKSKHDPALPLYTLEESQSSLQYFKPVQVGENVTLSSEISFRFVRAAHILGSCMAEIALNSSGQARRLLFTGDIGRVLDHAVAPGKVVHSGPAEGEVADLVVMESTYGNRQHPKDDPLPELAELISTAAKRGGSVVVPAFAIERTQKFVFILKHLMEEGQIPRLPVFCDSPMAIKAVEIFLKHDEEYSDDTRDMICRYGSPLQWPGFTFAETAEESKKINAVLTPCIIISSSGMVTGGRILHHLAQRLPDPKNLVLFIGFQAPGTRGFTIKSKSDSKSEEVKIYGDLVPIRAQVAALEQFSDHADPPELLEWLRTFRNQPATTYLVHGEPDASAQLRDVMTKELGWNVEVAQYLEKVEVK